MALRNSADPAPLDVAERARRDAGEPDSPDLHMVRGDVARSKGRLGVESPPAGAREVAA